MRHRVHSPLADRWAAVLAAVLLVPASARAESPAPPATSPSDQAESAAQLLHQAMVAETQGDADRRQSILETILARWPDYESARWFAGQVRVGDTWMPVGQAMQRMAWNLTDALYLQKRDVASGARDELELARWAREHQQPDRAKLHYGRLIQSAAIPPEVRREALAYLDCQLVDGVWMSADQAAEYRQAQQRTLEGLQRWIPTLARWQNALSAGDRAAADRIGNELAEVPADQLQPLAMTVRRVAGYIAAPLARLLVERLADETDAEAPRALCEIALLAPAVESRQAAMAVLRERRLEDSVPYLLDHLQDPTYAQFRIWWDSGGRVYCVRDMLVPGKAANWLYRQSHVALPSRRRLVGVANREDEDNGPGEAALIGSYNRQLRVLALALEGAQWRAAVNRQNVRRQTSNQQVYSALEGIVGATLPRTREAWTEWWNTYRESYESDYRKPTIVASYRTMERYEVPAFYPMFRSVECFAAGTPVWTETGLMRIETIKPGDRVLSRDTETGRLGFRLVEATTERPPTELVELRLHGEAIRSTRGHMFWVTDQGWTMSKKLTPDARLHGLAGSHRVESVEHLPQKARAYNLIVEGTHTYFVGESGILVHDNTTEPAVQQPLPGFRYISR